MKKILVVLFLLISFNLFATSTTGYVHINGYYEEQESTVVFKVWRETYSTESDRIYHAGDIYMSGDPTTGEVTIFNWALYGNKSMTVNLTFTVTPLQAFSNGTYYVPKHTVKMYDGVLTKTHDFSVSTTGTSPYPDYRQSSSGAGSFIVKSAVFSYTENISDSISKTGYCTYQILEYDEDTAGNFDYVSYVTVEFSPV